jgi:hypothetical protein
VSLRNRWVAALAYGACVYVGLTLIAVGLLRGMDLFGDGSTLSARDGLLVVGGALLVLASPFVLAWLSRHPRPGTAGGLALVAAALGAALGGVYESLSPEHGAAVGFSLALGGAAAVGLRPAMPAARAALVRACVLAGGAVLTALLVSAGHDTTIIAGSFAPVLVYCALDRTAEANRLRDAAATIAAVALAAIVWSAVAAHRTAARANEGA